MYYQGDVFVGLFKKRNDPYMNNCHWGLLFLGTTFDNMEFIHAMGNFVDGWVLNRKTGYSAIQSRSLLRLVHIGRVSNHGDLIQSIFRAVPAVNGNRAFDCKVWVLRSITFMLSNGRIHFKTGSNIDGLAHECQLLADTAAMNGGSATRFDIRTANACIIPPVGRLN